MYEYLYKYKTDKQELKKVLNHYNCYFTEEENRFIVTAFKENLEKEIIKIAFNEEGLFENYKEYSKYYLSITSKDNHGKPYINDFFKAYYKSLTVYDEQKDNFQQLNLNFYDEENFYILKETFTDYIDRSQLPNKKLSQIRNDASSFYKLKKSIMDLEIKAAIDNITLADIGEDTNNFFVANLDKFYPKKSHGYFLCPKCDNGLLNFDVEHFLKNSFHEDFKSIYKCSNLFCNYEIISFEKLREVFAKNLYNDNDLKNEFQNLEQNNHFNHNNFDYDYDYEMRNTPKRNRLIIDASEIDWDEQED